MTAITAQEIETLNALLLGYAISRSPDERLCADAAAVINGLEQSLKAAAASGEEKAKAE